MSERTGLLVDALFRLGPPGGAGLLLLILAAPVSGQDPQYRLELSNASGQSGTQVSTTVTYLSSAIDSTLGWSFGVEHDSTRVTLVDVQPTAALTSLLPEFQSVQPWAFGWTAVCVLSFDGSTTLPAGSGLELFAADYHIQVGCSATGIPLTFTGELGFPHVPIEVTTASGIATPTTEPGLIEVEPSSGFFYIAPEFSIPQGSETRVPFSILEDVSGTASGTQGFSMGVLNDPGQVRPVSIDDVGVLAAFAGGDGPGFFQATIYPNGWTVGVVYFGLSLVIYFEEAEPVVEVSYEVTDGSVGDVSPLTWTGALGSPPIENVVVVGGSSLPACLIDGFLTVTTPSGFVRGDANSDGVINVADTIRLLERLFEGFPATSCPEADDANDDTSLDIADPVFLLEYAFYGGPPPPPPGPECGSVFAELGCKGAICP